MIDWKGSPRQGGSKALRDALERMSGREPSGPIGHVMVGVGPGRDGEILSLAWYAKQYGGVALWILMSPEWKEAAMGALSSKPELSNSINIHARPLTKVCCAPIDLLYVDPVASSGEMDLDPYVRLYRESKHMLSSGVIAVADTDAQTLIGKGSALVSVLMANGWRVAKGESGAVMMEK